MTFLENTAIIREFYGSKDGDILSDFNKGKFETALQIVRCIYPKKPVLMQVQQEPKGNDKLLCPVVLSSVFFRISGVTA